MVGSISRWVGIGASVFALAGCANGGLLDPVAYEPIAKPEVAKYELIQAQNISAQSVTLSRAADGYKQHSDALQRDLAKLHIPLLALALGTAANALTGGNGDATIGLGLGTAALGATRVYFAPEARIKAYGEAVVSLRCASNFAYDMADVTNRSYDNATESRTELGTLIGRAGQLLVQTDPKLPEAQRAELLTARDGAQASYGRIDGAVAVIERAPAQLYRFELAVIAATTAKVQTATQNLAASLAVITAAGSTGSSATPAPAATGDRAGAASGPPISDQIAQLRAASVSADQIAKTINDSWANLANCPKP